MKWLVQLLGFQQRRYISTRTSIKKQETGNPHGCQSFFRSENLEEMRNKLILSFLGLCLALTLNAQTLRPKVDQKKVYNEDINPIEQIDQAIVKSKSEGKFVICQVGGNWCPWCLRFADFITNDTTISKVIDENFVYIHVNYNPRKSEGEEKMLLAKKMLERLNNPARFGFPVFVVLDDDGKVIHIQDSSFLEEGQGYDQKKVLRFFKNWTPKAVKQSVIAKKV
jgi:thioredoxin-related protein